MKWYSVLGLAVALASLQCIAASGNVGFPYNVAYSRLQLVEEGFTTGFSSARIWTGTDTGALTPNKAAANINTQGADQTQLFAIQGNYGYFIDTQGGTARLLRRFRMPGSTGSTPTSLVLESTTTWSYDLSTAAGVGLPADAGRYVQFIAPAPASCVFSGQTFIAVGYGTTTANGDGAMIFVSTGSNPLPLQGPNSGRTYVRFGRTPKLPTETGYTTTSSTSPGSITPGNPLYFFPAPDGSCGAIVTTRDAAVYGATAATAASIAPVATKTSVPTAVTQRTDAVTYVSIQTLSITKIAYVWDTIPGLIPSTSTSDASLTTYLTGQFMTMPARTLSPHGVATDDGTTIFLATQVFTANSAQALYQVISNGRTFDTALSTPTTSSPCTARLLKFDVASFAFGATQKMTTTKATPTSGDPPFISAAQNIYLAFTERVNNDPSGSIIERAKVYAWFPLALVLQTSSQAIPSAMLKFDAATLAMEGVQSAAPQYASTSTTYISSFYAFPVFVGLPYTSDVLYAYRATQRTPLVTVVPYRGLGRLDGATQPLMSNTQLDRFFSSSDVSVGDALNDGTSSISPGTTLTANTNTNPLKGEFPIGYQLARARAVDTTQAKDQYMQGIFMLTAEGNILAPDGGIPTGPARLLTMIYTPLSPCPGGGYQDFCDYLVDPVYERTGYAFGATMAGLIGISLLDNFLGYREAHKYGKSIIEPGTIAAIDLAGGPAIFPTSSLRPGGHLLQFTNHLQHVPVSGLTAPHFPSSFASFTRANGWALGHFPLPWYYGRMGPLRPKRFDLSIPGRTRRLSSLMTYVGDFLAYSAASTLVQSNLFYGMLTIIFVLFVQLIVYFAYRGVADKTHDVPPTIRWPRPLMATLVWIWGGFIVSIATTTRQGMDEWRWASAFMLLFIGLIPLLIVAFIVFWYLRINKLVVFLKRARHSDPQGNFVQKKARACWAAFAPSNVAAVLTGRRVVGDWVSAEYFADAPIQSRIKPQAFRDWFGIFYEDYKFDWLSFMYGVFDLARKFYIGCTVGLLLYYPDKAETYVQLASLIVFHVFLLLYICIVRPWRDPCFNIMDAITTLGHLVAYIIIIALQRNTDSGNRDRLAIGLVILAWAILGVQLLLALINRYIGRRWFRCCMGAHEAAAPHYARPEYANAPRQPAYGPAPQYRDNAPQAKTIQL